MPVTVESGAGRAGRGWLTRAADGLGALLFPPRCVHCGAFERYLCEECLPELEPLGDACCRRCGAPVEGVGAARPAGAAGAAVAAGPTGAAAGATPAAADDRPGSETVAHSVAGARFGEATATSSADAGDSFAPAVSDSWAASAPTDAAGPARCATCLVAGYRFTRARSAFAYRGPARSLVTACKGGRLRVVARVMAELAEEPFLDFLAEAGVGRDRLVITWVPAHGSIERRRGYNHAEALARALATRAGGVPVRRLCRKVRRTAHQQGLDRRGRQQNLRGAFAPLPGRVPPGTEGVIVVDDVFTTGVTASEVAAVVAQAAGGVPVGVFTFCRTHGGSSVTLD